MNLQHRKCLLQTLVYTLFKVPSLKCLLANQGEEKVLIITALMLKIAYIKESVNLLVSICLSDCLMMIGWLFKPFRASIQ